MREKGFRATLAVHARCALGEGATWCARSGRFYWTDIEGARLYRFDPSTGERTSWPMPERLATFALCADPHHLLLGLATHLAFFDLTTHEMRRIVEVEPGLETRLNDGRCDRQGRFVFGTKYEGTGSRPVGGFYRLNHDLSLEKLPLPVPAISNSIGFSPDGATMYFCDTPERVIRACDYGVDGAIANVRVFARLLDADGGPDGSTVDAEGGLWNAQWGGSRVVRYGPDGVETERVSVPTSQPSCVALGGPHLATLYVTSARVEMEPAVLAAEAGAGGIFIASSRRRGLPEPLFLGQWR